MSKDAHIRKTIEDLERLQHQYASKMLEARNSIATLKEMLGEEPEQAEAPKQVPVEPARKKQKLESTAPKLRKTKHKGVYAGRIRKDGTQMWLVACWDSMKQKNVKLGSFTSELEAAAVAKRFYEQAKQRQADMAEQAENNPDRPGPKKRNKKTKTVWVCKRCGVKWDFKPKNCTYCQNDDFCEKEGD